MSNTHEMEIQRIANQINMGMEELEKSLSDDIIEKGIKIADLSNEDVNPIINREDLHHGVKIATNEVLKILFTKEEIWWIEEIAFLKNVKRWLINSVGVTIRDDDILTIWNYQDTKNCKNDEFIIVNLTTRGISDHTYDEIGTETLQLLESAMNEK